MNNKDYYRKFSQVSEIRAIRHTQLILPPTLKVEKSDFEPRIGEQLAND